MATAVKNLNQSNQPEAKPSTISVEQLLATHKGENATLPLSAISFSPFNYRKFYDQKALEDFAATLKGHGIISPLIVRRDGDNKFQLVSGERRLRAATIAGLNDAPCRIFDLSDEQVREIQLAENIQRENPHPMDEAQAIGALQNSNKTIDDIALQMGKSKSFVYSRIKLLSLEPSLQEMFYAGVISIHEAFNIATLSPESQRELYESACKNWQKQKNFKLSNLTYLVNQFRYDLNSAPFDKKNKDLVPEAGSCQLCPFNSGTLKSLFPEYAKQATCSNKSCYQSKCTAQLVADFTSAFEKHLPEALLFYGDPGKDYETIVNILPEIAELPQFTYYDVTPVKPPELPSREDYETEDDGFDEQGYDQAIEEYNADLQEMEAQAANKKLLTGLLLSRGSIELIQFTPGKKVNLNAPASLTAKEVQEAIKSKTATPQMLQSEVERIKIRENRARALDKEKILLAVHEQFSQGLKEKNAIAQLKMTAEDATAARLIIYQSLRYPDKGAVEAVLFSGKFQSARSNGEKLYERLATLTPAEHSFLIRKALVANPDSKYPTQISGYVLLQVAKAAGTNVSVIEKEQTQKAEIREQKLKERIKDLQGRMKKKKAAA